MIKLAGITLTTVMLILGLIACPKPDNDDGGGNNNGNQQGGEDDGATLFSLKYNDNEAIMGDAVDKEDWNTLNVANFTSNYEEGKINISANSVQNVEIKLDFSEGADAKFSAAVNGTTKPTAFPNVSGNKITLTNNQYVYVKVFTEDDEIVHYYRFAIAYVNKSTATLSSVTVAGKAATLGTPNANVNSVTTGKISSLVTADLTDATIAANPTSSNATAVIKVNDATATANKFTLKDADVIVIEVTAEDGTTKLFYKIEVEYGRAATFSVLTVGGTPIEAASWGTPAATWAGATEGTWVGTASAEARAIVATPAANAKVQYGVSATDTEPTWADTGSAVISLNNYIGVKVTSGNGNVVNIYKIKLTLSNNADLDPDQHTNSDTTPPTHTYGGVTATGNDAGELGTPSNSLPISTGLGEVPVSHKFDNFPEEGIAVTAKTQEASATVAFATGAVGAASTALTFTNATGDGVDKSATVLKPANATDILYVKVTAADGTTVKYWALTLAYIKSGMIKYGKPTISLTDKTIDSLWDDPDLDVYPIDSRTSSISGNDPENNAAYQAAINSANKENYTYGEARCLWDEDGIYVYIKVSKAFYTGTAPNYTTSRATFFGTATNNEHKYDSVEIFINEKTRTDGSVDNGTPGSSGKQGYSDRGGQYRLSPDGTNMRKSGDPSAATNAWSNTFPVSGWTVSATDPGALDGKSGYVIIMKVPFRYTSTYAPVNGKKIGFDLQINVASAAGTRTGVMVWKNRTGSNYQDCKLWGEATLVKED